MFSSFDKSLMVVLVSLVLVLLVAMFYGVFFGGVALMSITSKFCSRLFYMSK